MEDLLTTQQVATLTNYSVVSIHRFVRNGVLKALRIPGGRKYMFEKSDIENMLRKPNNAKKFDLD